MILSRGNLKNIEAGNVLVPAEEMLSFPEKVLQFGTGVLLRGLPDYFIDKANRQGLFKGRVVVVKSTGGPALEFQQQDNLYTLCVRGIEQGAIVEENVISGAISRVLSAAREWEKVLEVARQPELRLVVSNTTEVGIALVKESISQFPPQSFPAKLLAVLFERYQAFDAAPQAGLVVIATELIPDNGKQLEKIVTELAHFNALGQEFLNWLKLHVHFCNSLVDRIVPGKPDAETVDHLTRELGYEDHLLSMVEPYRLWAIEGSQQIAEVLEFAQADPGVVITEDIERFRELKVRLLNGTHTLSCGIAVLAGIDTVKNGMKDEFLRDYITSLMQQEIASAIPYPVDKDDALDFSRIVLDRFANPYIEHLWLNITVQYSMKMKIRILPVLQKYNELFQKVPEHIAFGMAAFLRFMHSVEKDGLYYGATGEKTYLINDDSAAYFNEKCLSPADYVEQVLKDQAFWGMDLDAVSGFVSSVQNYYNSIEKDGLKQAMSAFSF